jgi:hypothetical protein
VQTGEHFDLTDADAFAKAQLAQGQHAVLFCT